MAQPPIDAPIDIEQDFPIEPVICLAALRYPWVSVLGRAELRAVGSPRDSGAIVQVGSAMAYQGIPLQAPYCGAKHAIKGFVESLRTELRHKGSMVHVAADAAAGAAGLLAANRT